MEVLVTVGTLYLVYRAIVPDQKTRGTRKTTTYQRQTKNKNRSIIQTGRLLHMEMITKTIMRMIITTTTKKKPKVNRREVRRTSDYSNSVNEEKRYGLINGSDEYWEYKDTAEKIYWDFCEARTTDARRMYKQEGEALKRKMISKYGADDESVKTIIERFLDYVSKIINKGISKIVAVIVIVLLASSFRKMMSDEEFYTAFGGLMGTLPFAKQITDIVCKILKYQNNIPVFSNVTILEDILKLAIMAFLQRSPELP